MAVNDKPYQGAARKILAITKKLINEVSAGDKEAEFHIRRYVRIRLEHDERGTPMTRKILKLKKFAQQRGRCAVCKKPMALEDEPNLHRLVATGGYTPENTELVHHDCHRQQQKANGYQ